MITRFGMSKKFGLMGLATVESQYLDGRASLTCSDVTAADIDTEVMKMLRDSSPRLFLFFLRLRRLLLHAGIGSLRLPVLRRIGILIRNRTAFYSALSRRRLPIYRLFLRLGISIRK